MRHVAYKTWAQGRLARKNSPSTAPLLALPRKSSPSTASQAAFPRKSSPSTPKNADCGVFRACRANYFALTHTSGHAGRTFSRTGHSHVATLKPPSPLQPPMQASMKPPSPLHAPNKGPLKPPSPLQPKNTPKTPISHLQRRRRFQQAHLTGPQRRWQFQLRLALREQR